LIQTGPCQDSQIHGDREDCLFVVKDNRNKPDEIGRSKFLGFGKWYRFKIAQAWSTGTLQFSRLVDNRTKNAKKMKSLSGLDSAQGVKPLMLSDTDSQSD